MNEELLAMLERMYQQGANGGNGNPWLIGLFGWHSYYIHSQDISISLLTTVYLYTKVIHVGQCRYYIEK